jgi:hypothetical protein
VPTCCAKAGHAKPKKLHSSRCCALHQEIPEEKLSRVSAYDWFGSVSMVPLAAALAGPAESAFGRPAALWGCAGLCVAATAAVLCIRDVRTLTLRSAEPVAKGEPGTEPGSADAEGAVGRLG